MEIEFDDLIGKTITKLESGIYGAAWKEEYGRDSLKFTTLDGAEHIYVAEGDCCSQSWFNHLSGLDFLIGQKVVSIQEKLLNDVIIPPDEQVDDLVQLYGWTFVTTLGHVDLEMRNASNGYYGGTVEKMDGWKNQPEWKLVTADF